MYTHHRPSELRFNNIYNSFDPHENYSTAFRFSAIKKVYINSDDDEKKSRIFIFCTPYTSYYYIPICEALPRMPRVLRR